MTYNDAVVRGDTFCLYCKNRIMTDKKVETYDKCKIHKDKKCTDTSFCEEFDGTDYWKEFVKPKCEY